MATDRFTHVWQVDSEHPQADVIDKAAQILRSGGLVAFPTETVYGLGANALDSAAVNAIYIAKRRPARNPLIVHVADIDSAHSLVTNWTQTAQLLAERFWPGPLTIVLPRSELLPDAVTGGGPTVALRWPVHSVAQALIRAAGIPVAAPSANLSSELSPTLPEHVARSLVGRIDAILDGGPAWAGIESTVIDLTFALPRLLRPGPIPPGEIEKLIGPLQRQANLEVESPLPSPGMLERHYAPKTPLECRANFGKAVQRAAELAGEGKLIALLTFDENASDINSTKLIRMPDDPIRYAADMYRILHELDARVLDRIIVELPPDTDEWLAVRDRLLRASSVLIV
jgi:L-threonylcarbamoyladenylate synthase